jgi:hypothetical protein
MSVNHAAACTFGSLLLETNFQLHELRPELLHLALGGIKLALAFAQLIAFTAHAGPSVTGKAAALGWAVANPTLSAA